MAVKKIDFEKSFEYFFKDKDYYQPRDCHVNAYARFYDKNYDEVERRISKFKYVTGFLAFEDEDGRKCIIHSWVEKDGCVIDTTPFANLYSCIKEDFSEEDLRDLKKFAIEKSKYVGIKALSDIELTKRCQQIALNCVDIKSQYIGAVEDFIAKIVESVSKDERSLKQQRDLGYEVLTGDYTCFIR